MPAPTPPTAAESEARARFVEAKNDVALLIECLNRGFGFTADGSADGFAEMLADLAAQAPKLGKAAQRLRHNLPDRADSCLPVETSARYFLVWPDGETFAGHGLQFGMTQRPAALRKLRAYTRIGRGQHALAELRLYDARDKTFIDPEEEP